MRRTLRAACATFAVIFFLVAVLCVVQGSRAYDFSGRWFNRATYVAECLPAPQPPNATDGCQRLLAEPAPPTQDGVLPTDKDLLLAEGSTMHNTATALWTFAGLLLAGCALLLSVWSHLRPSERTHRSA